MSKESWKCVRCKKKHRSNPQKCKNCKHTVLEPIDWESSKRKTLTSSSKNTSSSNAGGVSLVLGMCIVAIPGLIGAGIGKAVSDFYGLPEMEAVLFGAIFTYWLIFSRKIWSLILVSISVFLLTAFVRYGNEVGSYLIELLEIVA